MKRTLWKLGWSCLLVLMLCAPALAADVRGVTDTEVRIGQWGPQTGPAAAWGAVARGTDLYFQLINDEGGVAGRKIKYYLRDDSYNPAKTKAIGKEFVEQIGVFAVVGGVGTGPGMAVRDYLKESNVIWVAPSTGSKNWVQPFQRNIFCAYPLYVDEAYLLAKYVYQNKGKKIAFFYQNDDYGKEGLEGAEKALKELGSNLVAKVSVEVPDTDLSSHAIKLKESGADVVIMWLLPKHAAIILGEAAKLSFTPQWVSSNTLSDSALMFQVTKGLWKGVICSLFGDVPDADTPLMKKYREAQKKFAPNERWGTFYYAGILYGEPLVEGLKRAGKNLTPETFIAAMETIKDWRGIGAPMTFTATDHQGAKSVMIGQVDENGNTKAISDWLRITK